MLPSALAGLSLGLSLIIAIGAQNVFVLRQGIRREHAIVVATICAGSDGVLIVLGASGAGVVLEAVPWLVGVARWGGATFLIGYGLLAARRAWRPRGALRVADVPRISPAQTPAADHAVVTVGSRLAPTVLTCVALTWLNPHVYLDTLFLLGSVAGTHGDTRGAFAFGAIVASTLWFFSLALGARRLGVWLGTVRAWRILDAVIALVMLTFGLVLALGA